MPVAGGFKYDDELGQSCTAPTTRMLDARAKKTRRGHRHRPQQTTPAAEATTVATPTHNVTLESVVSPETQ